MNALNTLVRPGTSTPEDGLGPNGASGAGGETTQGGRAARETDTPQRADRSAAAEARTADANGMAVASFVLGLVGLLVFNLVLGPCALVLAGLALTRGTTRRGRALLGMSLGAADLIVLGAVAAADQSLSWSITG